ncbi:MAG: T9SS type A sorting domain-containing protein [Candidatus Kapabacteria bacterium]|nr:T9SS type A sorting domain-containing protein [Candidatus Kapabacteria bacterium]
MKNFVITIFVCFATYNATLSQPVLISEYLIGSLEWTELLIIEDNVSLVGYKIRDNSQDESWMGGVIFKDHRLWRNLRRGTVIIINHQGFSVDENKDDGYIEIGKQSGLHFTPYMEDGSLTDWADRGLNLNFTSDMIQLLDPDGNHVHVLAHVSLADKQALFASLPNPKIGVQGASPGQGYSLRVVPGANKSQYGGGLSNTLAALDNTHISKGKANNSNLSKDINQLYWRELRQPDWTNPAMTGTQIVGPNKDQIRLEWTAASSISDPIEGYMILRYVDNDSFEPTIEDGKIYTIGQTWGPYTLIGYVTDLTKTEFIDKFDAIPGVKFECGRKYGYRVYAYRYNRSDFEADLIDVQITNGRGRSYNENQFAQSVGISKAIPPKPVITSLGDITTICSNVELELTSSIKDLTKYSFQWFNTADASFTSTEHTVIVKKSGHYYLEITDKNSGCISGSNTITITVLDAPEVYVTDPLTFKTFAKDTIIQLCIGQNQILRGLVTPTQSDGFYWLKDGNEFSRNNEIVVAQDGVYQFVAVKSGLCSDSSYRIEIRIINPDFTLSDASLSFNADTDPEKDLTITNNTNKDIIFSASDVIITGDGFTIVSPQPEPIKNIYTIPANSSIVFKIRFAPVGFGTRDGQIAFRGPCNVTKVTSMTGLRPNQGVSVLDPAPRDINFGIVPLNCDQLMDSSITLFSTGPDKFMISKPVMMFGYFDVSSPRFNNPNEKTVLNENNQMALTVRVLANTPGIYIDTALIAYHVITEPNKVDTMKIHLSIEIIDPKLDFSTLVFDFSNLPTCVSEIDTFITVSNNTTYPFNLNKQGADNRFLIVEAFPIVIGANSQVDVKIKIRFTTTDTYFVNIPYLPCTMLSPQIAIIPPQIELEITVKNEIDFGIIKNCEESGTVTLDFDINASNIGGYIGNIIHSGTHFSSNVTQNKILNQNSNKFTVTLDQTVPGIYLDSLVFVIKPCDERIVIKLKAERTNPLSPQIEGLLIAFGSDALGVVEQFNQTWTNPDPTEDLIITSITVPAPFELISHTPADFPLIIPPQGNIIIVYEFKRLVGGDYTDYVTANVAQPCNLTIEFGITGEAVDDRMVRIDSEIRPSNIVAELGAVFDIPIFMFVQDGFAINGTGAESLSLYISYEPTMLYPENVVVSANYINSITQASIIESQPGKLIVNANLSNLENLVSGNWFNIRAQALLGNKIVGPLVIDSVVFTSIIMIDVEEFEGQLQIVGNCDLDSRLLDLSGNVGMVLTGANPLSGTTELVYSTVTEDLTAIKIYNSFGELVETLVEGNFKPGNYTITIDAAKYSSGAYLIRMISGMAVRTEKLIILN